MAVKIPPGETTETLLLYARQDTALVGLLGECLSQLAFKEVDQSGVGELKEDAWASVVRLCEATRENCPRQRRDWRRAV